MIAEVGDLEHSPVPLERGSPGKLSFTQSCASPPVLGQLRVVGILQAMTASQASALGVRFEPVHPGSAIPSSAWALTWRSGRLAVCAAAEGNSTLVYGTEADLGLLIAAPRIAQATISPQALQATLTGRQILAVGTSSTDQALEDAGRHQVFQKMISSLRNSRPGHLPNEFLNAFEQMRALQNAEPRPGQPLEVLGVK